MKIKSLKYLFILCAVFMLFITNVSAETTNSLTDDATTCVEANCDYVTHTITINFNDEKIKELRAFSSPNYGFSYADDDHQIYGQHVIEYGIYDEKGERITEVDEEVEILIKKDGLTLGTEYNVYYFDSLYYPIKLDKNDIGDVAEVVEIDGELYIKLVTYNLKGFALETDVSDEYKAEWAKISKNGVYSFPAIKPTKTIEDGFDFWTFFGILSRGDLPYKMSPANEFHPNNEHYYMTVTFDSIPGETHVVEYKWQEDSVPKHLEKEIDEIEKNIKANTKPLGNFASELEGVYFEIEDLNYVNFLYNTENPEDDEAAIQYSSDIKKIFGYNNFKYYFDFRAGNITPFYNHMFGYMLVEKDSLLYSIMMHVGVAIKPVIYIPDNIADNDQAYMDAAVARIKKYLNIDNVSMRVAGKRTDLETQYPELTDAWGRIYNEDNLSDNYYILNIDGKEFDFLIEKSTKKAKTMEFKTKDIDTNIEINTDDGTVPHDTHIEVEFIGKDHKDYNKILENLKKDYADIYDLKLFSDSKQDYITQLPNGKFKVRIPLKEEYKNKVLKVYYVADDGTTEEYIVDVVDGCAVFETNHFSTYSLVVDGEIENPNTGDNLYLSIILSLISFGGLVGFYKKNI